MIMKLVILKLLPSTNLPCLTWKKAGIRVHKKKWFIAFRPSFHLSSPSAKFLLLEFSVIIITIDHFQFHFYSAWCVFSCVSFEMSFLILKSIDFRFDFLFQIWLLLILAFNSLFLLLATTAQQACNAKADWLLDVKCKEDNTFHFTLILFHFLVVANEK